MASETEKEWFKVEVTVKQSHHSRATDVILAINSLLSEMGFKNHECEWFWGRMPGEKRAAPE